MDNQTFGPGDLLSKSAIGTFKKCPRSWKYIYIDKIQIEVVRSELELGIKVHQFMAEMWSKNLLKFSNDSIELNCPVDGSDIFKRHVSNIVETENKRWNICKTKPNPNDYFYPIFIEKEIIVKELGVKGIVDQVCRELNDEYSVVEIKSGKPIYPKDILFELNFYKYLIDNSNLLDKKIQKGVVYYTSTNDIVIMDLKNSSGIKRTVSNIQSKIKSNIFPKRVSVLCNWCDFKSMCLDKYMWRGG